VVDIDRLAGELEMRMLVVAAVAPAAPRIGLLLRDADHRHAAAPVALGTPQIRARDVLLAGALREAHDRNLVVQREAVDRLDIAATDPPEDRRRRDVAADTIQQKAHQLPVALQARDVAGQKDPIHRRHPQRHVIGQ
jgi:hypothetical protein